MTRLTTVIFDMYETLAHNEHEFWYPSFDAVIARQGLPVERDALYNVVRVYDD